MTQPLSRLCCGALSALLLLSAPAVQGASKSSKSSKSRTGSKSAPAAAPASTPAAPAPAEAPAPAPAAESKPAAEPKPAESKPAAEPKPAVESRPALAPRAAPAARAAPVSAPAASASPLLGKVRIGVGGDLFFEGANMTGEQRIGAARFDESFGYSSAGFLSGTAWLTTDVPSVSERLRVGAGLRIFGNYAAGGGREFAFGLLNEAFVSGEYGLPVADKTEVVFGGRVGFAVLVPNGELLEEIHRLQEQGVSVWSVPRVGWLVGPSVGARRRMSDRIWLRADLLGQVEQQYLFVTSEDLSGVRFTKNWSTLQLRLGLLIGAEFAL